MSLRILFLFLLSSYAFCNTKCIAHYVNVASIDFGRLFLIAKTQSELSRLNDLSREYIVKNEPTEEEVLNHMINTLLYFRGLQELRHSGDAPVEFENIVIDQFYAEAETAAGGRSMKLNHFRKYIEAGLQIPAEHSK